MENLYNDLLQKVIWHQKSLEIKAFSCWFRCPLHEFVRTFHIENKQKCWNIADFREILLGVFNACYKSGAKTIDSHLVWKPIIPNDYAILDI